MAIGSGLVLRYRITPEEHLMREIKREKMIKMLRKENNERSALNVREIILAFLLRFVRKHDGLCSVKADIK
jgi:hypothetical protein